MAEWGIFEHYDIGEDSWRLALHKGGKTTYAEPHGVTQGTVLPSAGETVAALLEPYVLTDFPTGFAQTMKAIHAWIVEQEAHAQYHDSTATHHE